MKWFCDCGNTADILRVRWHAERVWGGKTRLVPHDCWIGCATCNDDFMSTVSAVERKSWQVYRVRLNVLTKAAAVDQVLAQVIPHLPARLSKAAVMRALRSLTVGREVVETKSRVDGAYAPTGSWGATPPHMSNVRPLGEEEVA